MNNIPSSASLKIVTVLDAGLTLLVEHVGSTLRLPFYHPLILGSVVGGTYLLLKHSDKISSTIIDASQQAIDALKRHGLIEDTVRFE